MTVSTTNIVAYFKTRSQAIQSHLDAIIATKSGSAEYLCEAACYALYGGKHLRPILTLETVELLGGNMQHALSAACALECIHTYSMIHDDLPCMDNDDYRRGRLTVHRKYSEGHAVLTGDFLLTYPFEILASDLHLSAEQKVQLIHSLAYYSGSEGMIGGQVMDLAFQDHHISIETLNILHSKKTGALITAAMEFGAIIGHATNDEKECLKRFGATIGLVYQIVDDILDVTASEYKHGSVLSSDIVNGKATYVSLLGLEEAKCWAVNFHQQAIELLRSLKHDVSRLVMLADFILHRTH